MKETCDNLLLCSLASSSEDLNLPKRKDLPDQINGIPVHYAWKDLISNGDWYNPERKFRLTVNPQRLHHWCETGKNMLQAGTPIPINLDHKLDAENVRGYIKDFAVVGDRLFGYEQLIGDDAKLLAARNYVSIGVDKSYQDGLERTWADAITHVALTPEPVAGNQENLQMASRSNRTLYRKSNNMSEITPENNVIHTEVPASPMAVEAVPAVEAEPQVKQMSADAPDQIGMCRKMCMSLPSTINDGWDSVSDQISAIPGLMPDGWDGWGDGVDGNHCLNCSQNTMDQLHSAVPGLKDCPAHEKMAKIGHHLSTMGMEDGGSSMVMARRLEPELQEAISENVQTKLDLAFSKGAIDRNTKTKLVELLTKTTATMSLSKQAGSNKSLAMSLIEILADNKPVEIKEKTGLQVMSKSSSDAKNTTLEELNLQGMKKLLAIK